MTDRVAVIGAGFAGLCMAIRLTQAGVTSFTVYEKADDLGGVWRDNTYPGAGCDIPSHLYSYSFAPREDWSRAYPLQPELLRYLRDCADAHGVRPRIRFGTEIVAASYDEAKRRWELRTATGAVRHARVLVTAVGQLNRPRFPDLPGREDFAGTAFHSARWDHRHDLAGRTVGVIGTGPSAVQFVPRIAPRVRTLRVFQRSANWVMPKWDYRYGPVHQALFRTAPGRLVFRGGWFALCDTVLYSAVRGGRLGKAVEYLCRRQLRTQIADPALRARLTPDFPLGCKRVLISDDYLPALARDNVELITEKLTRITPRGVVTADGTEHALDTLIYGTGFTATEFLAPVTVTGRDGRLLREEAWADGAAAFLGMTVPGFPNLFLLYGPNTNLGNNSVVLMIEAQVRYVLDSLAALDREGRGELEVSARAYDAFQRRVQEALGETVWQAGCDSWYKTDAGKITNNWPYRAARYRSLTRRPGAARWTSTDSGSAGQ
ncbi:flavin-containing monooxygenase [Streptomyces spectabilis]|uniref:NAD(P)/FAD-dependent oxidoreductase n=1 Tax=Streptomyces spectabilis TaxID=68270 RepID=A0A516R342_STRST|nr:NAD(P)/FAD-dependent oxidoreductase [Streptomyces spectabilis]QDQ10073.1 NAD(P)/FAD-dependent oxidoreductase [Streptomyces spectabilis]